MRPRKDYNEKTNEHNYTPAFVSIIHGPLVYVSWFDIKRTGIKRTLTMNKLL